MNASNRRSPVEPIAIIGMACRFPGGANDLDSFWGVLTAGLDVTAEVPRDRWDADAFYDPQPNTRGKSYVKRASFLKGVDIFEFDAEFFGIPPVEARVLDPQQRLLLEVAWEATEHACLSLEALNAIPTGVFIGMMNDDLCKMLTRRGLFWLDSYCYTGNSYDVTGGRVSYTFDLHGPNMVVNSACSSSLLSVHLACQSIRNGECGIALAGGINLMLSPEGAVRCSRMRAVSPDGRSKTFDVSADGFGRGEGCGVVVLKSLAAAQAAGDRVLAVIRATATNHDGHGTGRTALAMPNGAAQEAMMWDALAKAGVEPAQVSYLEAHGTGTPVGDPIEVAAVGRVFGTGRPADHPLQLGSVKSNIGHLEGAAGIAGLIKTVLALNHGAIPPNLHLRQLNPAIDLAAIPAEIPVTTTPWPRSGAPRLAGVNSFGMGGTNAFAVVEEAPPAEVSDRDVEHTDGNENVSSSWLLPLSARSPEALRALAGRYRDYLSGTGGARCASMRDICHVAAARRTHHRYRLAVGGTTALELAARLDEWLTDGATVAPPSRPPGIVFVFSGQGSQWPGMGRRLMAQAPVFRESMERCDAAMRPFLERGLLEMLNAADAAESLGRAEYTQPAIFAMQIALTALWRSWGIEPQAVVGHSMAELVAAHVAGALAFDDAARFICQRARIQARVRGQGGMLAVGLPAAEVEGLLLFVADRVSIAVVNSPRSCVLSGDLDALARIENRLVRDGVFCRRVQVDVANHSYQLDPHLEDIRALARDVQPHPTTLPMYSTVTGARVSGLDLDADHWVRNVRQPVLFADAFQRMLQDGHTLFLEVSPHTILGHPIEENLQIAGRVGRPLPSMRRNEDESTVLLSSVGRLYVEGHKIDWKAIYPTGRPVDLPAYPWQRQRHWDDSIMRPARFVDDGNGDRHPFLLRYLRSAADRGTHFWEVDLDTRVFAYLADHKVMGGTLFPGAGYLEMVLAATQDALGDGPWALEDVRFEQALFLPEAGSRTLQLVFTKDGHGAAFRFFTEAAATNGSGAESASVLHASGLIRPRRAVARETIALRDIETRCAEKIDGRQLYRAMEERGLHYGPAFQGVVSVNRRDGEAIGSIALPESLTDQASGYIIHPAVLDAALQAAAAAMHETAAEPNDAFLPIGMERVVLHRRVTSPNLRVIARAREATPSSEGILHADIQLVDENGKPVLDVDGFRVRRLAGSTAARDPWTGWFYALQWQPKADGDLPDAATAAPIGPWLLFADQQGSTDALRTLLEERGERCVTVTRGSSSTPLRDGRSLWNPTDPAAIRAVFAQLAAANLVPRRIVYAWGVDITDGGATSLKTLDRDRATIFDAPLHILQAIDAAGWPTAPDLAIVTRGAQQTPDDKAAATFSAASLWGLARTIAHEHPELRTKRVDLDPGGGPDDAGALLSELFRRRGGDEVALRSGGRYEMRIAPILIGTGGDTTPQPALRADGTYLVTGGLGGLGLVTAEWLADNGAGHLVLMGRSAPSPQAEEAIERIEDKGTKVTVVRGDITRDADVAHVLESTTRDLPPLRGVFHSAAVLDDAPLVHFSSERGQRVLAPKVDGTWSLHERTLDRPLDFFVLYSSIASMVGFAAQGAYAAGNAFMDSLAQYRRAHGLPGLSINWGPWSGVGLAARLDESLKQRMISNGMRLISPARGRWALTQLLAASDRPGQVGVFNSDWSVVLRGGVLSSLSLLSDAPRPAESDANDGASRESLLDVLANAPPDQWRQLVSKHVTLQVVKALGYPPDRPLDPEIGFFDLGMDSLRAVDLRNALQASSGLALRSMVAFEHPTIHELSAHLLALVGAANPHVATHTESVAD